MIRKTSEIAMLGGALALSLVAGQASAAGATACNASAATLVDTTATSFVKTPFTPKCSANTKVIVNDAGSDFAVGGGSSKGKTVYGASTMGGQVGICTTSATPASAVAATPNSSSGC